MRKFWDTKRDNILRRNYPKGDLDTLAERIGVSKDALKSRAQVLGIHRKVHVRVRWTEKHLKYLRDHYATVSAVEIAQKLKRGLSGVYVKAKELGLEKSPEFLRECGRRTAKHPASIAARFRKGQTPPNKGKRQEDFMSPEGIERTKPTRFKKGHAPHNTKPVGYERIDTKDGYVFIKVAEGKPMVLKHRYIWEQYNGIVPDGYCVAFRDGNRLNCDISNLFLISMADNARRRTAEETPEQRRTRIEHCVKTKRETIRRDRLRIKYGLKPMTRLVKHGY